MTKDALKQSIQQDMVEAMRAKDKDRLNTIRLLMAAIKQREIDDQKTLHDSEIISVIEKMIKQRRESIKQFEAGNRPELAKKEQDEIKVLENYMPEALSEEEIIAVIDEAIKTTGANTMKDMGKVMGIVKGKLQGRADMSIVSSKVKERLNR